MTAYAQCRHRKSRPTDWVPRTADRRVAVPANRGCKLRIPETRQPTHQHSNARANRIAGRNSQRPRTAGLAHPRGIDRESRYRNDCRNESTHPHRNHRLTCTPRPLMIRRVMQPLPYRTIAARPAPARPARRHGRRLHAINAQLTVSDDVAAHSAGRSSPCQTVGR